MLALLHERNKSDSHKCKRKLWFNMISRMHGIALSTKCREGTR